MKKILSVVVVSSMIFSCMNIYATNDKDSPSIPEEMKPSTIITYDEDLSYDIETVAPIKRNNINDSSKNKYEEIVDKDGRAAEDEFVSRILDEGKDLPHYEYETVLPKPFPGMKVIYGTDGGINHILNPDGTEVMVTAKKSFPGVGERGSIGEHTYGAHDNTITISKDHVYGEGRFTVFRAGVGGSNDEGRGSSGKILGTGDVATKWEFDNPYHNTEIEARATDTDIKKKVYKNDIGSLPDAVLDIYFWGWNDEYFGYEYSDSLSFPGRYYYEF